MEARRAEKEGVFLLTPLREGRRRLHGRRTWAGLYFYSRPCGRGDNISMTAANYTKLFLLTPLREGRPQRREKA